MAPKRHVINDKNTQIKHTTRLCYTLYYFGLLNCTLGARDFMRSTPKHHTAREQRKPLVPAVAKLRLLIYEAIPNN